MPENRQIRLARRPHGEIQPDDWEHATEDLQPPEDGQFAARTLTISLDPAMRGWLDDRPAGMGVVERFGRLLDEPLIPSTMQSA